MATQIKDADVSVTIKSESVDYALIAYGTNTSDKGTVMITGEGGSFSGTTKIAAGYDANGEASTFDTNPGDGTVVFEDDNIFSGTLEVKADTIAGTSSNEDTLTLNNVTAKFSSDIDLSGAKPGEDRIYIGGTTSISKIDGTQVELNDDTYLTDGTTLTAGTNVDANLKAIENATVTLEGGAKFNSQNQLNLQTGNLTLTGTGTELTTNDYAGANVDSKSTLTIEDGAALTARFTVKNFGTLNVENATLTASNSNIENYGTMNLTGATLNAGSQTVSNGRNGVTNVYAGTTTIISSNGFVAIADSDNATLNLEKDAVLAFGGTTKKILNRDSTINLKGGTIADGATISEGTVNWVLDNSEYKASSLAWSVVTGAYTKTITVDADATAGDTYTLATSAAAATGTEFTLTGGADGDQTITVGGAQVSYDGWSYTLAVDTGNNLVLSAKKAITITAESVSKMYDGTALTSNSYEITEGGLIDGDVLTVTTTGSIAHFGKAANEVASYKVMRGTEDVTAYYDVTTVDGELSITKRDVTMTSATDSKIWDGTALTNTTVTESGSGFVAGEGATYYNFTASQTEIGSTSNAFSYALKNGTSDADYAINVEYGTLAVYPPTVTLTVTENTRARETVFVEDRYFVMTRRSSVAINALASETTDEDQIAVKYLYNPTFDGEITLNGDIVVTDRAADETAGVGHDTYGVKIASPYAATNLTTNYASRTTVTRDTKSTEDVDVYGIYANSAVNAAGTFKNTVTVTATNSSKNGGELTATGLKAEELSVGDYAATLRVSALDKAAQKKKTSFTAATGIDATGVAAFGRISKSIYAYASGDGAEAAGVAAGKQVQVTGDIDGAVTVRAVSDGATGLKATATGFSADAINVGGAVTKAVTVTAQNTNKTVGTANAKATAFDANGPLTITGGIDASVKATASSAAGGSAFAYGLLADGDMTVKSLKTVTATATSASGKARAEAISTKGKLTVTDGALGTLTATAKGSADSETRAYGIRAASIATDGVAALKGTIKTSGTDQATGILISGEQAALTAELQITAGDTTTKDAYGITFNDKAELKLKDSTVTATGTEKSYALYSGVSVDASQSVTLENTTANGNVSLSKGDDTLAMAGSSAITGNVNLGEGENKLTMADSSKITGNVTTGADYDEIAMSGSASIVGNVSTGDADDEITLEGTSTIGAIEYDEKGTKIYTKNKPEDFVNLDMGEADGDGDTLTIYAGARVTANVKNVERATFNLSDMNPRTYLWVGTEFKANETDIVIDVSNTDFTEGKERWFTVGRDMDGEIDKNFGSISVSISSFDKVTGFDGSVTINGAAVEDNGWTVSLQAVTNDDGSQTLFAVVEETGEHAINYKYGKVYQINAKTRSSLNGTSGSDWMEFNNGYNGQTAINGKTKTMAGDDVLSFRTDTVNGTALTYTLNLLKNGADAFDLGDGIDVLSTYQYNASPEVTNTSIKKVTRDTGDVPESDDLGYYHSSTGTEVNTVELQSKKFSNSTALENYFTNTAHVEALLGQFRITTDDGNKLTLVEGLGSNGSFNFDKLSELEYTDFEASGDTVTLNAGEIKDVTGYTNLTFGTSGTVKVNDLWKNVTIDDAWIDESASKETEKNKAEFDSIAGFDAFTGTVYGGDGEVIVSDQATATFDSTEKDQSWFHVTSVTGGTMEATGANSFSTVDFNGSEAGQSVTANNVVNKVGVVGGVNTVWADREGVTGGITKVEGFTGELKKGEKTLTADNATVSADKDIFTSFKLTNGTLMGFDATTLNYDSEGKQYVKGTMLGATADNGNSLTGIFGTNEFEVCDTKNTFSGQKVFAKYSKDATATVTSEWGTPLTGAFTDATSVKITGGTALLSEITSVTIDSGTVTYAGSTGSFESAWVTDSGKGVQVENGTGFELSNYSAKVSTSSYSVTAAGATAKFASVNSLSEITSGTVSDAKLYTALGASTVSGYGYFTKAEVGTDDKVTLTSSPGSWFMLAAGSNLTADTLTSGGVTKMFIQSDSENTTTVKDVTGFTGGIILSKTDGVGNNTNTTIGNASGQAITGSGSVDDYLTLSGTSYGTIDLAGSTDSDILFIAAADTEISSVKNVEQVGFYENASAKDITYEGYSTSNKLVVGIETAGTNSNIGTIGSLDSVEFSYYGIAYTYDGMSGYFTATGASDKFQYDNTTGALSYIAAAS